MIISRRVAFRLAQRKMIEPEPFTVEPLENMFKISSQNYQFVIDRRPPPSNIILTHLADTPAAVLKKPAIHIFPDHLPPLNRSQKLAAVTKQIESTYANSFRNCKNGKEIFHLERKNKVDIRNKLYFIGSLSSRFHHMLQFQSILDTQAKKTQEQYQQKGVEVQALGQTVYPLGPVWMPTSQRYLTHYIQLLKNIDQKTYNVLDLGCGCGILSFLFAKHFKKSRIVGIDQNKAAVDTTNVNAVRMNLKNIQAIEFDLTRPFSQFKLVTAAHSLPQLFDWIVVNPPWISAKSLPGDSVISLGVYDHQMKMLSNSLDLAKKMLAPKGKIIVIYSDLSQLIGLTQTTVETLTSERGLAVDSLSSLPLLQGLPKKSALQQYKSSAKILTYTLRHQ